MKVMVTSLTRPSGPNLGASAEAEPISPPTAFMMTAFGKTFYDKIATFSKFILSKRSENSVKNFNLITKTHQSSLLLLVLVVPSCSCMSNQCAIFPMLFIYPSSFKVASLWWCCGEIRPQTTELKSLRVK